MSPLQYNPQCGQSLSEFAKRFYLIFYQDFQCYASKVPKVKKISREVDEAYKNSNVESEIF